MNKLQFTLNAVADWVQRIHIGEEKDRSELGLICLYGSDAENFSYSKSKWLSLLRDFIPTATSYDSLSRHKSLLDVLRYIEHELGYASRSGAKTFVFAISHSAASYGFSAQASARQVGGALADRVRGQGAVFAIDIDPEARREKPALADFCTASGQAPILLRAFSQLPTAFNQLSELIGEARTQSAFLGRRTTAPITYAIAIDTASEMFTDKTDIFVHWQPKETAGGIICPACEGTGHDVCPECCNFRPHGGSAVMWDSATGNGFVQCRRCTGAGFSSVDSCPICHGRGYLTKTSA
jgi:hypothetical protein